jgi:predicted Zn-dependent protease
MDGQTPKNLVFEQIKAEIEKVNEEWQKWKEKTEEVYDKLLDYYWHNLAKEYYLIKEYCNGVFEEDFYHMYGTEVHKPGDEDYEKYRAMIHDAAFFGKDKVIKLKMHDKTVYIIPRDIYIKYWKYWFPEEYEEHQKFVEELDKLLKELEKAKDDNKNN